MELVLHLLAGTPLIPPVGLEGDHLPLHFPLAGPDSHGVKPWHLVNSILHIKSLDPLIYPRHLLYPIDIGGGSGPVVSVPHELGRREQGSNCKRIAFTWVEGVLVGHVILEPLYIPGKGLEVPTFYKVIETSNKQDSHGPADPAVLSSPGYQQVLHLGSWDGNPVHVRTVWRTDNSWVPRLVEVVKGAVRETDIEPIGHGYQVSLHTRGAQILPVPGGILHTLQDPDLACGPVVVVYGDWSPIPGLLVGADLALGVPGAGAGGHRGLQQQVLGVHTGHSIRQNWQVYFLFHINFLGPLILARDNS